GSATTGPGILSRCMGVLGEVDEVHAASGQHARRVDLQQGVQNALINSLRDKEVYEKESGGNFSHILHGIGSRGRHADSRKSRPSLRTSLPGATPSYSGL